MDRPTKKLSPIFIGPYTITEVVSSVAYKLKLPHTMKIHPVFHVSKLKPYLEDDGEFPGRKHPNPAPEIIDGEEEFEVEEILDRRVRRNQTQYLVKWVGYPDHDNTWEPESHLANAKDQILRFRFQVGNNS
jgi:hypothetical protein